MWIYEPRYGFDPVDIVDLQEIFSGGVGHGEGPSVDGRTSVSGPVRARGLWKIDRVRVQWFKGRHCSEARFFEVVLLGFERVDSFINRPVYSMKRSAV